MVCYGAYPESHLRGGLGIGSRGGGGGLPPVILKCRREIAYLAQKHLRPGTTSCHTVMHNGGGGGLQVCCEDLSRQKSHSVGHGMQCHLPKANVPACHVRRQLHGERTCANGAEENFVQSLRRGAAPPPPPPTHWWCVVRWNSAPTSSCKIFNLGGGGGRPWSCEPVPCGGM